MASEVDIANRALGKLGAATIIDLNEDDPKAVALQIAFPTVRQAELRRRRWRFSLERHSLPALADAPAFGFARQFQLPAGCLRVIQIGEFDLGPNLSDYRAAPTELWSIEGRKILTNLGAPLKVRTIQDVPDTTQWDAAFVEAFAARLAYECCERITQSDSKKQLAWSDYREAIREAVRANALEVATSEATDDTWVMARLG